MPKLRVTTPQIWQHQADATLSQDNPVSTTLYTVLAATKNVRIVGIEVAVTWTVQPTPLDIVVTIDGNVLTFSVANPVSTTKYFASHDTGFAENSQLLETADRAKTGRAFLLEGRSIKVEARTTGGTTSNLAARVKYAKIP